MSHKSKHRVNGGIVHVKRDWHPTHIEAGYHEHEWGEHATPDHELLGHHEDSGITVAYIEDHPEGAGGPEFELTFPGGVKCTVICADVVQKYLTGDY